MTCRRGKTSIARDICGGDFYDGENVGEKRSRNIFWIMRMRELIDRGWLTAPSVELLSLTLAGNAPMF
jgi:hypothetical protein